MADWDLDAQAALVVYAQEHDGKSDEQRQREWNERADATKKLKAVEIARFTKPGSVKWVTDHLTTPGMMRDAHQNLLVRLPAHQTTQEIYEAVSRLVTIIKTSNRTSGLISPDRTHGSNALDGETDLSETHNDHFPDSDDESTHGTTTHDMALDRIRRACTETLPSVWYYVVHLLVCDKDVTVPWYQVAWLSKGFTSIIKVWCILQALLCNNVHVCTYAYTHATRGVLVGVWDVLHENFKSKISDDQEHILQNVIQRANKTQKRRASITPLLSVVYEIEVFTNPFLQDGTSRDIWNAVFDQIGAMVQLGNVNAWNGESLYPILFPRRFVGSDSATKTHADILARVYACDVMLAIRSPIDGGILGFSCANNAIGRAEPAFTVTVTCFLWSGDNLKDSQYISHGAFVNTKDMISNLSDDNLSVNTFRIADCKDALMRGWHEVAASRLVPFYYLLPDLIDHALSDLHIKQETQFDANELVSPRAIEGRLVTYVRQGGNHKIPVLFRRYDAGQETMYRAAAYAMQHPSLYERVPGIAPLFAWSRHTNTKGTNLFLGRNRIAYTLLSRMAGVNNNVPRPQMNPERTIDIFAITDTLDGSSLKRATMHLPNKSFHVLLEIPLIGETDPRQSELQILKRNALSDMVNRNKNPSVQVDTSTERTMRIDSTQFNTADVAVLQADNRTLDTLIETFTTKDLSAIVVVYDHNDVVNRNYHEASARATRNKRLFNAMTGIMELQEGSVEDITPLVARAAQTLCGSGLMLMSLYPSSSPQTRNSLFSPPMEAFLRAFYNYTIEDEIYGFVLVKAQSQLEGMLSTLFGGMVSPRFTHILPPPPKLPMLGVVLEPRDDDAEPMQTDEIHYHVANFSEKGIMFAIKETFEWEDFLALLEVDAKERTDTWIKSVFALVHHAFTNTHVPLLQWIEMIASLFYADSWTTVARSDLATTYFIQTAKQGIPQFAYCPIVTTPNELFISFAKRMGTYVSVETLTRIARNQGGSDTNTDIMGSCIDYIRTTATNVHVIGPYVVVGEAGTFTMMQAVYINQQRVPSFMGCVEETYTDSARRKKTQLAQSYFSQQPADNNSTVLQKPADQKLTILAYKRLKSSQAADTEIQAETIPMWDPRASQEYESVTNTDPATPTTTTTEISLPMDSASTQITLVDNQVILDEVTEVDDQNYPLPVPSKPALTPNAITFLLRVVSETKTSGNLSDSSRNTIGNALRIVHAELYHDPGLGHIHANRFAHHTAVSTTFSNAILNGYPVALLPRPYTPRRVFGGSTSVEVHRLLHLLWTELVLVFSEVVRSPTTLHPLSWLHFYCRRFHEAVHMHVNNQALTALDIVNRVLYVYDIAHSTYTDPVAFAVIREQEGGLPYPFGVPSMSYYIREWLGSRANDGLDYMVHVAINNARLTEHFARHTGFFSQPWPLLAMVFLHELDASKYPESTDSSTVLLVDCIEGRPMRSVTPAYIRMIQVAHAVRSGMDFIDRIDKTSRVCLRVTPSHAILSETAEPMYTSIIDLLYSSDQSDEHVAKYVGDRLNMWKQKDSNFPGPTGDVSLVADSVFSYMNQQIPDSASVPSILLHGQCPPAVAHFIINTQPPYMRAYVNDLQLRDLVVAGPPRVWFKTLLAAMVLDNDNAEALANAMYHFEKDPWDIVMKKLAKGKLHGSVFDKILHLEQKAPKPVSQTSWLTHMSCMPMFLRWVEVNSHTYERSNLLLMEVAKNIYLPMLELAMFVYVHSDTRDAKNAVLLPAINECDPVSEFQTDLTKLGTIPQGNRVAIAKVHSWLQNAMVKTQNIFDELEIHDVNPNDHPLDRDSALYMRLYKLFAETFPPQKTSDTLFVDMSHIITEATHA